ncbi:hypothetical protein K402DRAFT_425936 [Aulographum hederae CBS 113979]|uniref:Uncharacterized protein n=1 Tax=Aulographum hederae CBS 113979 TaxID=1176131 RepID=A0A6G1GJ49_9PEZI|nr:hypothetical protein K402DRAFT_425936 [Aulographum hederae CBS 113979]
MASNNSDQKDPLLPSTDSLKDLRTQILTHAKPIFPRKMNLEVTTQWKLADKAKHASAKESNNSNAEAKHWPIVGELLATESLFDSDADALAALLELVFDMSREESGAGIKAREKEAANAEEETTELKTQREAAKETAIEEKGAEVMATNKTTGNEETDHRQSENYNENERDKNHERDQFRGVMMDESTKLYAKMKYSSDLDMRQEAKIWKAIEKYRIQHRGHLIISSSEIDFGHSIHLASKSSDKVVVTAAKKVEELQEQWLRVIGR